MRAKVHPIVIVAMAASAASCTALLGLDDKTFGTTSETTASSSGSGGGGGNGSVSSSISGSGSSSTTSSSSSGAGGAGGASSSSGAGGGSASWVFASIKSSGSPPDVSGVAIDGMGYIWVVGSFSGKLNLASCAALSTIAGHAAFWARFDQNGNCDIAGTFAGSMATDNAYAKGITIDLVNGPVIVGKYQGTLNTTGSMLTSLGGFDLFTIKLNSGGSFVWAQSIGGAGDDEGNAITAESNGDTIVAGSFTGPITVKTNPVSMLPGVGNTDVLVAKLALASGTPVWVRSFGSKGSDVASAVSVSKGGGLVGVTGSFAQNMDAYGKMLITSIPNSFAVVFDPINSVASLGVAGTTTSDSAGRAATLNSSGVQFMVGGEFTGALTLGGLTPVDSNMNDHDGFVAQIPVISPTTGTRVRLGQPANGPALNQPDTVLGLARHPLKENEVVAVGSIQAAATFLGPTLTCAGKKDVFVAKFNSSLTQFAWEKSFGDEEDQEATAVAIDGNDGAAVIVGQFKGALDLGGGKIVSTLSSSEIFVARLLP